VQIWWLSILAKFLLKIPSDCCKSAKRGILFVAPCRHCRDCVFISNFSHQSRLLTTRGTWHWSGSHTDWYQVSISCGCYVLLEGSNYRLQIIVTIHMTLVSTTYKWTVLKRPNTKNVASTILWALQIEIAYANVYVWQNDMRMTLPKLQTVCFIVKRRVLYDHVSLLCGNYCLMFFIHRPNCVLQPRAMKMHLNSTLSATRCTKTRKFRGQQRSTDVCQTTAVWLSFVAIWSVVSFPALCSLNRRGLDNISRAGNGQVVPHLKSLLS